MRRIAATRVTLIAVCLFVLGPAFAGRANAR